MSDTQKLANSARRHLRAAEELKTIESAGAQPGCKAVAGYLFGLAGELAVKQLMRDAGIPELPPQQRRQDPYYAHFPLLKTQLSDQLSGRRSEPLKKALAQPGPLFHNWSTDMRYDHTQEIQERDVDAWCSNARYLVGQIGLF
ncbi:MAG: hypothetical protein O9337_13950 [Acidovorax sp.]|uniref:hypothetical protein n=1 Tax=Acidovorax sp. TaxID=1872122 RepID=UPI0022CC61F7|nr:hypothetical protein [Acidovorax sp.]MCZ8220516.1 hypothetical protein [Acidovorax sp.]